MTGPITIETPVRFQDTLPDAVDVAIIGGGVIGVFSALYLARAGKSVLICEKGRIAGEQSSRNWGWIRQQGRDPAELPIMSQALGLWHDVTKEVKGRTGVKTGGVSYLASSEKEMARLEKWVDIAAAHNVDSLKISKKDVDAQFSGAGSGRWVGGILTPSDARGEPWQAVPAVAELARDNGVKIRENCAVRCLHTEAGQVKGIVTEDGTVKAQQVILAGGAWSSLFARANGVNVPQLSVHLTVARTAPLPQFFNGNAADEKLALRRREDGGYTLAPSDGQKFFLGPDAFRHLSKYAPLASKTWKYTQFRPAAPKGYPDSWRTDRSFSREKPSPFEQIRVLNPNPDPAKIIEMQHDFAQRFPEIGEPAIATSWAGMIDTMPDVVPIVDRVSDLPGLIVATGMSGHGFGIGPGFGRVIARMVEGLPAEHDLSRFRFSRFSDESRIDLGPSI